MLDTGGLGHVEIGGNIKFTSGFPFASKCFSTETGFPLIRIRDIQTSKIETYYNGLFLETYVVQQGDILIGMDGDFHVVKWRNENGLLNQRILKIEVYDADIISLGFLYYWLGPYIQQINDKTAATTVKHLSIKDIKKATGLLPKIDKQRKIAFILETIDQTIEKTESLIHKYQQIKAGLMHDLFSRGLTADGKLRPPREEAPELYQETSIGWIPKEWSYEKLANLLSPVANSMRSGPFGSALLKSELVGEGIPLLGIDNIKAEYFIPVFHRFVSNRKFNELNKYAVKARDVIITIMGTVGRCAVVPNDINKALSSKHLWTMTFDQRRVIPELICWQLNNADWVQSWFRKKTQGGIMDAIQSNTLKTLVLPIPPINEQKKISERYHSISSTIKNEKDILEKLKKQKSGLMHDLLTGKVQVKINKEVSAHGE